MDMFVKRKQQLLALLVIFTDAAVKDERAPILATLRKTISGNIGSLTATLVNRGEIETRVFGHNWRVVYITKGRYAGKHTKLPPMGWQEHTDSLRRRGEHVID